MSDEIEEIKRKLDIVDLVGQYVGLKKAGSNYKGNCPFHQEKTPSFMVNPELQIFKCFGCGEGGDIFTFIEKVENLDFKDALLMLSQKAGVELIKRPGEKKDKSIKNEIYKINHASALVFQKVLNSKSGAQALKYLKERGLSDQTILEFQIGFAPSGYLLSDYFKKNKVDQKMLNLSGNPEKFHNRIIFPIEDNMTNIVGFTGRSLDDKIQPKYYNTPETSVFKKSLILYGLSKARKAIKTQKEVIVTEGQMDVIASHQAGVKHIVASSGTAITESHLEILSRYGVDLIVAFDADEAGKKATYKIIELALKREMNIKVVTLPVGFKDIGEVAIKDKDVLKNIIKNASFWMDWIVKDQIDNSNLSVGDKKQIVKNITGYLKWIVSPIELSHWIKILSEKLGIDENSIKDSLSNKSTSSVKTTSDNQPVDRLDLTQEIFVLFELYPETAKSHRELYSRLKEMYNNKRDYLVFQYSKDVLPFDSTQASKEVELLLFRARQIKNENIKKSFAENIAQAESTKDRKQVIKLLKQLQDKLK